MGKDMSKYIDAERLKAEIEKPKNELKVGNYYLDNSEQAVGYENALIDFELLIDSLQQEQPEEPDKSLEEEVKNYFQGYWPGTETAEQCNTDLHFTPPAIIRLARHFAQWGAEHATNAETPADLEEAADEYEKKHTYQRYDGGGLTPEYNATLAEAFIAGYNLFKEQMMEEAVECSVYAGKEGDKWIVSYIGNYESMMKICKDGDKVRIIIVKEEDKQ